VTATPYSAPGYTVTVAPTTNGTVTVSPSGTVGAGATVTLTAAPSASYGLSTIRAYRTGASSITVTLAGSGNTRTFVMPAYGVTVEATFQLVSPASQQDVNSARSRIESATFTVAQATANTPSGIQTWLAQQIGSLIASTGVTVSGVTVGSCTAAVTGTATRTAGTDGSFTFTASLAKNGATAVTTSRTGRITATAYSPQQYAVTVAASSGGTVTASVASAPAGSTVTLTVTPNAGYETDAVGVRATTSASSTVALSGSGSTRTFTMPAFNVTVTATFKKTQAQMDREAVETAKVSLEGGTFRIAQATGNTEASVKTWLAGVLRLLLSDQNAAITFRSGEQEPLTADVALTDFTPAIGGTEAAPAGTDGFFRFSVSLAKGDAQVTTQEIDGVIVAMPHSATPVKRIELLSLGETRVRIINTGNLATGDLTLTLSGTDANLFTLPSATAGSLETGGEADITLVPRDGLAAGTYTVIVTVSGDGLTPVSLEVTYRVMSTGAESVQAKVLKAFVRDGRLHVDGLTAGKPWYVYGIGGSLVYGGTATGDEADVSLPGRGVFIVTSDGAAVKAVY
jgi:hypothetical protein